MRLTAKSRQGTNAQWSSPKRWQCPSLFSEEQRFCYNYKIEGVLEKLKTLRGFSPNFALFNHATLAKLKLV
jgi:hypothetical protein